jgi:hypothetical protein
MTIAKHGVNECAVCGKILEEPVSACPCCKGKEASEKEAKQRKDEAIDRLEALHP